MNNFYKLRHIPSGLFFKPSINPYATNLTKTGKAYTKKPSKSYVKFGIRDENSNNMSYIEGEWEIVTFKVIEILTEKI